MRTPGCTQLLVKTLNAFFSKWLFFKWPTDYLRNYWTDFKKTLLGFVYWYVLYDNLPQLSQKIQIYYFIDPKNSGKKGHFFNEFFKRPSWHFTLFHDILHITNPNKNLFTLNISKLNTRNWKFSNRSLQKLCHLHPYKSWNAHWLFNFLKFLFLLSTNRFMDDNMTVAIICEAARNNLISQSNGRARN